MPPVLRRRLGNEGPEVSVVGLGCNNFGIRVDLEGTRAVVDAALDAAVTLFDTADIYGNKGGSGSDWDGWGGSGSSSRCGTAPASSCTST
jgi:aryl-alcohol dehydrogenase-like predicted oxidoreductase